MQYLTVAAATALVAASTVAAGTANVYNTCSEDVYLWSVTADLAGSMVTIPAGGSYSETYQTPSVGGVSLKLNLNDTCDNPAPISQFEYTVAGSEVYADMSNVNCGTSECPFKPYGWYLDMGSSSCPTRNCAANAPECTGAYIAYNDDENTVACAETSDIALYLCTSEAPSSKRSVPFLEEAPHRQARHLHHPHGSHVRR